MTDAKTAKKASSEETEKPQLEVNLSSREGAAIISLSGDFLGGETVHFRRACTQAEKQGLGDAVVELSDVERIDGYGLASLVGLLARTKSKGGRLLLCGINPDLRARFEATHCDGIFETAFTVAKAVDMLKEGQAG